ncbi:MAG: hypothetical protein HGA45_26285 [Chloroflexales bacterium]|nr:hypothetical protein [Chloroflexales bacterium]
MRLLFLDWLGPGPPEAGLRAAGAPGVALFSDGFVTATGWKVFEELAGGPGV